MFNKNTKVDIGNVEFSIKDSDPYTKTNLVCFRRIDPLLSTKFEMFLTDEQLIDLGQAINNHTKESA